MKTVLVPEDLRQRLLDAHVQDGPRGLATVAVEKSQVFVQDQIRLRHEAIGFGHQGGLMSVSPTEVVELLIRDHELPDVSERLFRVVLSGDHQHLKALPPERLESGDVRIHVFVHVEPADHRVQLELDAELPTPVGDQVELVDLIPGPPADRDVSRLVEGVAGDRENVDVAAVFGQERLGHQAAICDNGDGLQVQFFFAVVHQATQEFGVEKRLSSSEV